MVLPEVGLLHHFSSENQIWASVLKLFDFLVIKLRFGLN